MAIRIPKAFAAEMQLDESSEVDLVVRGDAIVIKRARRSWDLAKLVGQISTANRHEAFDWGRPTGKESW